MYRLFVFFYPFEFPLSLFHIFCSSCFQVFSSLVGKWMKHILQYYKGGVCGDEETVPRDDLYYSIIVNLRSIIVVLRLIFNSPFACGYVFCVHFIGLCFFATEVEFYSERVVSHYIMMKVKFGWYSSGHFDFVWFRNCRILPSDFPVVDEILKGPFHWQLRSI